MPMPGRATQTKRIRERANQERKAEKAAERARRKEDRKNERADANASGEDPDLVGIIPGPQPPAF
jgi:hypothetical protein